MFMAQLDQPHIDIKIIDPDTGKVVLRCEFCTRGYSVMQRYWGDAEKTRESIDADGWMHTGDLATMDDEGYVNIASRIKDMVMIQAQSSSPYFLSGRPTTCTVCLTCRWGRRW